MPEPRYLIWMQEWNEEEYLPGWGLTVRPDGASFHSTKAFCQEYVVWVMQNNSGDLLYKPANTSTEVEVDKTFYDCVKDQCTLRLNNREYTVRKKVVIEARLMRVEDNSDPILSKVQR